MKASSEIAKNVYGQTSGIACTTGAWQNVPQMGVRNRYIQPVCTYYLQKLVPSARPAF